LNFIPQDIKKWYLYENWLTTFRFSVLTNLEKFKLHNQPQGEIISQKIDSKNFQIDTLENEWMKLTIQDSISGWIQWKKNDSILIENLRFIYF